MPCRRARKTRYALEGKEWAAEAWDRLKRPIVESLRWYDGAFQEGPNGTTLEEGRWVAGVLGIDLAALESKAREEIPDARWWGNR